MNNSQEYIEQQLTEIVGVVGSLEEGGNINEIQVALDHPVELRTLQRRLKTLLMRKIIEKTGQGKATKYFRIKPVAVKYNDKWQETQEVIPLSKEAKLLQHKIGQPIQRRNPVVYNQNFLKSYQPNASAYPMPTLCMRNLPEAAGSGSRLFDNSPCIFNIPGCDSYPGSRNSYSSRFASGSCVNDQREIAASSGQ